MRRLLFALTLALYGFSAMDLHEWAHVPQVVLHMLEHHSDLGHHDEEGGEHHDEQGDHAPFHGGCNEAFCACGGMAFVPLHQHVTITSGGTVTALGALPVEAHIASYSGSIWNPPKA